jgi:hypothetical protein
MTKPAEERGKDGIRLRQAYGATGPYATHRTNGTTGHHPFAPAAAGPPPPFASLLLDNPHFLAIFLSLADGRVAERLKAPDSKSGLVERLTWVQIPPLPFDSQRLKKTR